MSCKKDFFMKEIFLTFTKYLFFSSRKTFLFNFLEFNYLGIFIAEANTRKLRYASAKALAFVDCGGEFRTMQQHAERGDWTTLPTIIYIINKIDIC